MLKIDKNIILNGISMINGVQVAYMNANIGTDGNNATISKGITNQDLYNAHKREVRADFADFEDEVYEIEDSLNSEFEGAEILK